MKANRTSSTLSRLCLVPGVLLALALPARAGEFKITVTGLEASPYRTWFDQAAAFWSSAITGYANANYNTNNLTGITIAASVETLGAGILGQAGPTTGKFDSLTKTLFATAGQMTFSSSYAATMHADGSFLYVAMHEMGHVLGFGTLWNYVNGSTTFNNVLDASGNYIGAAALAAYREEFGLPDAQFIPVEKGGGSGTAGGHWDEVDGGNGLTGVISLITGLDMKYELMTGWVSDPMFVSRMTLAMFEDIGYTVDYSVLSAAVPEPAALPLLMAGIVLAVVVACLRRRRRAGPAHPRAPVRPVCR
ncbi:PEP-CTERM putative exosortase interaction domain-containing protein [Opitutaceae bacterium TAV1]|nr:PEP-CTERM putative exosortase interaction domain-containing protein [Opitutaceae bacterium TAV1]